MKPKTKLQHKIVGLSSQLPEIDIRHKEWASRKLFESWGVLSRNKIYCLDCGHSWKDESPAWQNEVVKPKCPECSAELKMFGENKVLFQEMEYFSIITTKENYQVVRVIASYKHMKKKEKPRYFINEVQQFFIDEKGAVSIMSRKTNSHSYYYDAWIHSAPLEIQDKAYQHSPKFRLNSYFTFPNRKVLPILKRNGFKGNFYDVAPQLFFKRLIQERRFETLLKTNQFEVLSNFGDSYDLSRIWPAINICIRNKYIVKDFSFYKDYIDLLLYFKKDILNAKYACPIDIKKEHNVLMAKKQEILRLERIQREINDKIFQAEKEKKRKENLQKALDEYPERTSKFFKLNFTDKEISIKVIQTIEEMLEEGIELKHCVHTNEYYLKKDSLILSARVNGERKETVEVRLSQMRISQCRGYNNQSTDYNQRIVDLVKKNLHIINSIHRKKNKKKLETA